MSATEFTPNMPRHPGMYEMMSLEGAEDVDLVRVFRKPFEGLWAEHRDVGVMPIERLHNGLTGIRWKPAHPPSVETREEGL